MTLKDQIAADKSIFQNTDEFGESAVYNGVPIVVIETGSSEFKTGSPGYVLPVFTVLVHSDDVTRPEAGDAVTFRGRQYSVGEDPGSSGHWWVVDLIGKTIQV